MKNIRPIIEIVGESIAFAVLLVMVCQMTKMTEQNNLSQQAIDKMAEQYKVSAASLARIDSTIKLMHEANELMKESNQLTRDNAAIELDKLREDQKRTALQESRQVEELRPRLVIKPFLTTDIQRDSVGNYTGWVTINNQGLSDAERVAVSISLATSQGVLGSPSTRMIKKIPSKKNPSVVPVNLPPPSENLFLSIGVIYDWILPSGSAIPYSEHTAYGLEADSLQLKYVRSMKLDEGEVNKVFKKLK